MKHIGSCIFFITYFFFVIFRSTPSVQPPGSPAPSLGPSPSATWASPPVHPAAPDAPPSPHGRQSRTCGHVRRRVPSHGLGGVPATAAEECGLQLRPCLPQRPGGCNAALGGRPTEVEAGTACPRGDFWQDLSGMDSKIIPDQILHFIISEPQNPSFTNIQGNLCRKKTSIDGFWDSILAKCLKWVLFLPFDFPLNVTLCFFVFQGTLLNSDEQEQDVFVKTVLTGSSHTQSQILIKEATSLQGMVSVKILKGMVSLTYSPIALKMS